MSDKPLETGPVVVLGAAGFIGARLVRGLLATDAAEVRAVDRVSAEASRMTEWAGDPRTRVHMVDLSDDNAAERLGELIEGARLVVHLAASTSMDRGVRDGGAEVSEAVRLDHAVGDAVRTAAPSAVLVFASSSAVYGRLAAERNCREDDGPLRPLSTYGAAKVAGEALLSAYHELFRLDVRVLRFGTVVGAGLDRGVVPALVGQAVAGAKEISVLGDGKQARSFVHVDDVITAIPAAATVPGPRFEVYNVAGDGITTVANVAARVSATAGGIPVRFGTQQQGWTGDIPVVRLDSSRMRDLGWRGGSSDDAVRRAVGELFDSGVQLREDELARQRGENL